jgi:hypothetical protein
MHRNALLGTDKFVSLWNKSNTGTFAVTPLMYKTNWLRILFQIETFGLTGISAQQGGSGWSLGQLFFYSIVIYKYIFRYRTFFVILLF